MGRERTAIVSVGMAAVLLAGCATSTEDGATTSASIPSSSVASASEPPSSAASVAPEAEKQPPSGSLVAGQVYVTDTDPQVQFTVDAGWTAIPSAGGVGLLRRPSRVWISTGFERAYVGAGELVEAGTTASEAAAQISQNRRVDASDPRPTELAGASGFEMDATIPYDANVEGGGPIFDTADGTLVIADLTMSRIYLLDVDGRVVAVIVAGTEEMEIEEVLDETRVFLESLTFP
jgi:hypothetical protein